MKNEFWVVPQMRMNLCLCLENRLEDMGPGSIFDRQLVKPCFFTFVEPPEAATPVVQTLKSPIYCILFAHIKIVSGSIQNLGVTHFILR